ncbi:Peptide deformylase [Globisporangium polare]
MVVFLGNPALRRLSKSVADVRSPTIRNMLKQMEEEVRAEAGVGIAAPQLGHNLRMFLMLKNFPESEEELDDPNHRLEYQTVINPEILEMSQRKKKDFEGCLSIPGYSGVVARAQEVKVQFSDEDGRLFHKTLRDFPARIFQHETDHLNGVLYLDRLEEGTLIHNEEFEALEWMDIEKLLKN